MAAKTRGRAKRTRDSEAQEAVTQPPTKRPHSARSSASSDTQETSKDIPNAEQFDSEAEETLLFSLQEEQNEAQTRLHELTLGKTITKVSEPGVDVNGSRLQRSHQDYLLQEMEWMAADFSQERRWRTKHGKLLSTSVLSHHNKIATRAARKDKMEEEKRRRKAAKIGRDMKKFWGKIDKIIEYKVKLQTDELRREAMDRHLHSLVSQTQSYAASLAQSFQEKASTESPVPPKPSKRKKKSIPVQEEDVQKEEEDGSDFEMSKAEMDAEQDDETTLAQEEEDADDDYEDELAALKAEGEMDVEALRAHYYGRTESSASEEDGKQESDAEFEEDVMEVDDERTLEEEERYGDSNADEVQELEADNELSVEELRAKYHPETLEKSATEQFMDKLTTADEDIVRRRGYKRPFLLTSRLSLRQYQEAGVNWLVTLCEKRVNGILADEMGLGKTIQTISLLAHLASERGIWGPHLIVVPTSCLVNWEMEFKRWCPALKILTYFGSAKRRKELRQGWSKANAFQVCITSYQLVVQDAHCFRRKKWFYLILDEAHHIKNFRSLRWQTLLNFNAQRRLLLTGTPLQNSLLELWALMHFLMPHVFSSRKDFAYWFQSPLTAMVETKDKATAGAESELVDQLHAIIRPFVLRRLKSEVEKQLPEKHEHTVTCDLSKRQRGLYEDFISRSSTRKALHEKGNFMSMMNVLMQLRKVCNHPDLFEPRPIVCPLDLPPMTIDIPRACAFLSNHLINYQGAYDAPYWGSSIAGKEGCSLFSMESRKKLLVEDVHLDNYPTECYVQEDAKEEHKHRPDVLQAMEEEAAVKLLYWKQKRQSQLHQMRVTLAVGGDAPTYGDELLRLVSMPYLISQAMQVHVSRKSDKVTNALKDMVQDPDSRIRSYLPIATRAMCYVPKARARPVTMSFTFPSSSHNDTALSIQTRLTHMIDTQLTPVASRILSPYYEAHKRTQLFFPDKRLLQFDCGKLQQLDILLRRLKSGNHRCLLFTQMSSMLDILEGFLNLHGHSYFRLDGSTPADRRQRLMERFNQDDKIFCFILSTRSGGLGVNLTGADCVIFYDSDWNPAMDAQAQDRAHRIGQTRDVHIYRLVTKHTVEENILARAQQKRQLDWLVMAQGNFTTDFFDKEQVSDEVVQQAMNQVEDEEDVKAMRGAEEEAKQDEEDFDDKADEEEDKKRKAEEPSKAVKRQKREEEDERKLQEWKSSVKSLTDFESNLNAVDRYALRFREEVEPLYDDVPTKESVEAQFESARVDFDEVDEAKAKEEEMLLKEGELIAGDVSPDTTYEELYKQEKKKLAFERRRRHLEGSDWKILKCVRTHHPFYYNEYTKEAVWDEPAIVRKNAELAECREKGFAGLPSSSLLVIFQYLAPLPDRLAASTVCKKWQTSASDMRLHTKVSSRSDDAPLDLQQVVDDALPGDTIVFASGVYSIDKPVLVKKPLRLWASPNAHVELQMTNASAQLTWESKGGMIVGIHLSRRQEGGGNRNWQHLIYVVKDARLRVVSCDLDGGLRGNACACVSGSKDSLLVLLDCKVYHAGSSGVLLIGGGLVLRRNTIFENRHSGVTVWHGNAVLRRNKVVNNGRFGLRLLYHSGNVVVEENVVKGHSCGNLETENSGRRFVIRWNDMVKGQPTDLPHHHGKLRLRVPKLEYRQVPVAPPKPVVPPFPVGSSYQNLAKMVPIMSTVPTPKPVMKTEVRVNGSEVMTFEDKCQAPVPKVKKPRKPKENKDEKKDEKKDGAAKPTDKAEGKPVESIKSEPKQAEPPKAEAKTVKPEAVAVKTDVKAVKDEAKPEAKTG